MGAIFSGLVNIAGTVSAPSLQLAASPLGGFYQLPTANGVGFSVNALNYYTLNALGATYGNKPATAVRAVGAMAGAPYGVAGSNGTSVATHPTLPFVYACGTVTGSLYTFAVNAYNGALTQVSVIVPAFTPTMCAVSPDGLFLYTASGVGGRVYVYSINQSTGALTLQFTYNIALDSVPHALALSPDGGYAAVATTGANVRVFQRNAVTGALTEVVGSPFATGGLWSTAVNFTADSSELFVANLTSNNLTYFAFNKSTGACTPVAGSPFATGVTPTDVTSSPDEKHVFVVNQTGRSLSVFALDTVANTLTQIAGSPYAIGTGGTAVAVSPDNSQVAVTNYSGPTVSVFNRNTSTGALAVMTGSPFAMPSGSPQGVVFSNDSQYVYVSNIGAAPSACVTGFTTAAVTTYNLLQALFDPTGGLGGALYVNGSLYVNGGLAVTGPALAGNNGKYLKVNPTGTAATWEPVTQVTPIALVANAAAVTVDDSGTYVFDVTGALTATGAIAFTFSTANPALLIVDTDAVTFPANNANILLTGTNGGNTVYFPRGRSLWYWNGTTIEQADNMATQTAAKSGVQLLTPADVTEDILYTINLPPLKANDQVRLWGFVSSGNNANSKIVRARLGGIAGTIYESIDLANAASANFITQFANRNNVASQIGPNIVGFGISANAPVTSVVNTGVPTQLVITGQKAVAGDVLALEFFSCEIISDGT